MYADDTTLNSTLKSFGDVTNIERLKLFFVFPTIPIICLTNIDKYYKICTFLKKSCIHFQNFHENVINELYCLCLHSNCTSLN